MKKIIMTGGGTAGHVTPNLALIPKLRELGYEIEYIGTKDGIERKIIEKEKVKYHIISTGKLRRYFAIKNFTDPFKVIKGVFQAATIIRKAKPDIVFSKGGFVAVPVVLAAFLNRIPVIAHESDLTPGLANKLSIPYCTKVCVTFPESLNYIKKGKAVITGTPIREELFLGSRILGKKLCNFTDDKPILLVVGGSLGSIIINDTIRESLEELLKKFNIIHICGKGNVENAMLCVKGYRQFEYINEELPHMLNAADFVVSRAGANMIFELLALKKPNILVPLSKKASRGDQILNARSFKKSGYSIVIVEENLNREELVKSLEELSCHKEKYIKTMEKSPNKNGVKNIISIILANSK